MSSGPDAANVALDDFVYLLSATRSLARFTVVAGEGVEAGNVFAELAARRVELGLPPAGSANDSASVAKLEIGAEGFYGVNAHGQQVTLRVNPISRTHAETEVFQKAYDANAADDTARLIVDRDLCKACGQNGAVKSLARQLGIKQLEVVTPSGTEVINTATGKSN
jgi:hypothetical protein